MGAIDSILTVERRMMATCIDEEYIVSIASSLVRINSENPPGREAEVASFLAERLSELGLKARVDAFDERANCIAASKDFERAGLLLLTHLDTVPAGERGAWSIPPFGGIIRDGKLYGRGAADAKGCIASMLGALKALADGGVELGGGDLVFAAVADEEVESRGVRRLIRRGFRANYAVVGEPTSLRICVAHKGRLVAAVKFAGRCAHSSRPELGINALYAASEFALGIEEHSKKISERAHPLLEPPTISATIFRAGEKDNVVPGWAEVVVDYRALPGEKLEAILDELRHVAEEVYRRRGTRHEIMVLRWVSPSEVDPRSRIVKVTADAARSVLGREPEIVGFQATCDMSYLVNEAGVPSIILGPGGLEQAHAVDEWVSVAELVAAAKIYALIIYKILCSP
jgi:acetylornithine deacetylase/succinyl-diaminopimelate desuccinylase family protein